MKEGAWSSTDGSRRRRTHIRIQARGRVRARYMVVTMTMFTTTTSARKCNGDGDEDDERGGLDEDEAVRLDRLVPTIPCFSPSLLAIPSSPRPFLPTVSRQTANPASSSLHSHPALHPPAASTVNPYPPPLSLLPPTSALPSATLIPTPPAPKLNGGIPRPFIPKRPLQFLDTKHDEESVYNQLDRDGGYRDLARCG
jgi:hypothetical protein